ncbi:FimV/HubP family polar landmark protein [Comamonas fluminis]|uniref:FimV/HubP family polar landmark protein n=1 Tax=Comamonas fluminis TaxID=2796366 RepID=UPI001C474B1B|nr:FimV/HubP family polar landmark protein [Comamonas fluminis]
MQRWKLSALAAASLALSSLTATDAWALALGRITVQSALGEPLRAEVEVPQLSAAEAESLQAAIAPAATFRAQGMEYTSTANSVRVKVQKRANGSAVLQLSSFQPVNDPFVDLVIDANWASGKIQRNYTLLLDPPTSRRPAPAPVTAAQAAAEMPVRPATTRPAVVERPAAVPATVAAPNRDLRNDRDVDTAAPKTAKASTRKNQAAASAAREDTGDAVRVKTGDTAGRLAAAHKPAGVSLDQMLVAMLRSNPQAFVNGNINRMRSGAVIQMPDTATAQATSSKEARQIMAAQSRDFNEFRRQLAGIAPVAPVAAASRTASGQVQAHVEDSKPSTAAPDKLTLSKGSVKGVAADEKLAQQKQSAEQNTRTDELKRNMAELSQIAAATQPAGTAAAPAASGAAPAKTPGVNVPATTAANNAAGATGTAAPAPAATPAAAPAAAPVTSPAATPAAPAQTPAAPAAASAAPADVAKPADAAAAPAANAEATPAADAPAAQASQPAPEAAAPVAAPAPAPKPAAAPVTPPAEPSFIDGLMEDPTIPLAGAAILALLLGYGGYRVAQRRKAAAAANTDSSLGDSQLAADSFFGASGGQRVDTTTSSSQMSGQSMQYSPSQLDAGDVDPLAEADVYLAYGRDLQAEEILKEALRTDPNRLVLHQKLAEIYAKRHDRIAFGSVASNLHNLTQGKGPEWQRVADQGAILDPENPLYLPGNRPASSHGLAAASAGIATAAGGMAFGDALASAHQTLQEPARSNDHEGPATVPTSMDFNLDLGLPSGLAETEAPATPLPDMAAPQPSEQDFASLAQWDTPAAAPAEPAKADDNSLNLDLNDLSSFSLPSAQAPAAAAPAISPEPEASLNALEFDLDSFTLPVTQTQPETPAPIVSAVPEAHDDMALNLEDELGTEPMTLQLPIEARTSPAEAPTPAPAKPEPTFDLSGLSLDLGTPSEAQLQPAAATPSMPEDPMATKLALAEEFNAIGDSDGARTLIEEVIAEAHGDLKAKAQALLSQIG